LLLTDIYAVVLPSPNHYHISLALGLRVPPSPCESLSAVHLTYLYDNIIPRLHYVISPTFLCVGVGWFLTPYPTQCPIYASIRVRRTPTYLYDNCNPTYLPHVSLFCVLYWCFVSVPYPIPHTPQPIPHPDTKLLIKFVHKLSFSLLFSSPALRSVEPEGLYLFTGVRCKVQTQTLFPKDSLALGLYHSRSITHPHSNWTKFTIRYCNPRVYVYVYLYVYVCPRLCMYVY
jgi:hypothetical protein